MKRIVLVLSGVGLALAIGLAQAQTTIKTVAGVFDSSTGSLVGAKNFLTSKEELFTLNNLVGPLSPAKGGTGVANTSTKTITLGGPLVTSGAFTTTLTSTATTNATLPAGTNTLSTLGANTYTGAQTAPAFIPNSATVPSNGMFLSAANMLGFATNGVEKWDINSSGVFLPTIDATYDIGGATKPRDISATRTVSAGTGLAISASGLTDVHGTPPVGAGRVSVAAATAIYTLGSGGFASVAAGLVFVTGALSTDNTKIFTDLVIFLGGGSATVISSQTLNTPAARTYSVVGNDLKVAMAANTYFVNAIGISQGN